MISAAPTVPAGSVPIAKLPTARRYTSEARENMNCKSCRKRKIKCSRTRPSCNACDVFRCECIYDAVPKKRGPKTEVLEELLKRIDGLEKRLGESENGSAAGGKDQSPPLRSRSEDVPSGLEQQQQIQRQQQQRSSSPASVATGSQSGAGPVSHLPSTMSMRMHMDQQDDPRAADLVPKLIDTFFKRVNGKPYSFFHEATFRGELATGTLPKTVVNAVCAAAVRYIPIQELGGRTPQQYAEEFANTARAQVDADEPTLENLQAMLLLSMSFYAMGYGKKAWMQMGSAIRMTLALDLHRELPASHPATPLQREIRRRVFWTCYLMDRFTVCGSMRPPQISDRSINLRLPCTEPSFIAGHPTESAFFSATGTYTAPSVQPHSNRLVDIVRILGRTIRYTQSGGIKGDSHFPWHSASHLSQIRGDLNAWASLTRDLHSTIPRSLDATYHFLARAIWHVIYCLMYRNFLPIDLAELEGQGTQQAWQVEAVKVCFQHANALVDLIAVAEENPEIEWPAFAGFALATAASVLVHGVFYRGSDAFKKCRDSLARVVDKVKALRQQWACMAQHLYTLRTLYLCHEHLVTHQPRISVFHLDDFFDRYSTVTASGTAASFESCHVPFFDAPVSALNADSPPFETLPTTSTPPSSGFSPYSYHQPIYDQVPQPQLPPSPHSSHSSHHPHSIHNQQQQPITVQQPLSPGPQQYSPLPSYPNPNNITDFLFPNDMGFSWISDWPVATPSMSSPSQQHGHLGSGSVPQIQGGLGFRQALFDEQLTGEEVLPIAAVAAEHEEDMIDEAIKMNYHQQRQQMMMSQGQQQQEGGRATSGQQQSQREHRNGIQQQGPGSESSTVHIEIDAFGAESVGMVDPPTNGSAGTGSNGGGDDELLNMLAEMAEREEADRKNAEGGAAAGGNDGNAGGDRESK